MVIVAHEVLDATQNIATRIVEIGRDNSLQLQCQDIIVSTGLVVQLIPDAMKKVIGLLDLA